MGLRQILFQIGKNVYGDFSDVATGVSRVEGSTLKETSLIKL